MLPAATGMTSRCLCMLMLLVGCRRQPALSDPCFADPVHPLNLAERFVNDGTFRRDCLMKSLVSQRNSYAQERMAHYTEQDWGSLPVVAFRIRPVRSGDLGQPAPLPDDHWETVPGGDFPTTLAGLKKRGEDMFTRFPSQLERSMLHVLRSTDGSSRYGLWQTSDSVGGLVWVALPGGVIPALTCSSCHAAVDSKGELNRGVPNHGFDLGKAKDDYLHVHSLFSTWGPGRQDIAADGQDNPVVIADLRPVRFQSHLHRTANLRNSLMTLALRVETGLITAHQGALRPERLNAFALAYYLWSLGEMFHTPTLRQHPAQPTFNRHCGKCHQGPALTGPLTEPSVIQSPVSKMPNTARGTGYLRTPSLLGVSARRRLLYGGEADGIESFLDPMRTQGGHTLAGSLTDNERQAIAAYLHSL